MFSLVKTWDNRQSFAVRGVVRVQPSGKTWTRRIRWLSDEEWRVKLKLEDGEQYREVIVNESLATIVWDRFRSGQSIEDCLSIFSQEVPPYLASKRGSEK